MIASKIKDFYYGSSSSWNDDDNDGDDTANMNLVEGMDTDDNSSSLAKFKGHLR